MDQPLPYDIHDQESLTEWCRQVPERIATIESFVPADLWSNLDFSPQSLKLVGDWIAQNFGSIDEIKETLGVERITALGAYAGEVHVRSLGWHWFAETEDSRFMDFRRPIVTDGKGKYRSPVSTITAFAHSHRPAVLYGALAHLLEETQQ